MNIYFGKRARWPREGKNRHRRFAAAVLALAAMASVMLNLASPALAADAQEATLDKYITSTTIQRKGPGDATWNDLNEEDQVDIDDSLRVTIDYEITKGGLPEDGVIVYDVPAPFKITQGGSGDIVFNGERVGTYVVTATGENSGGRIELKFDTEYIKKNIEGFTVSGTITVDSTVKSICGNEEKAVTIEIGEGITLNVTRADQDLTVEKKSQNVHPTEGTLDYEITVSSVNGTSGPVVLTDVMTNVEAASGCTIKDKNERDVQPVGGTFPNITLPQMGAGDKYVVTYHAKLTAPIPDDSGVTATNQVTVSSKNKVGSTITDTAGTDDRFTKRLLSKSGVLDENGTITWTIQVNSKFGDQIDLSGWTLRDQFGQSEYEGEVTIAPDPKTGKGSITTSLPYIFPSESKKLGYTVTYTTTGDANTTNKAVLTPPYDGGKIETGFTKPGLSDVSLKKEATGSKVVGTAPDGSLLTEESWRATIEAKQQIQANFSGYTIFGTEAWAWASNFWFFRDTLLSGTNSYYTLKQMERNAKAIEEAIQDTGYEGNYYILAYEGDEDDWVSSNRETIWLIARSENARDDWDSYKRRPSADTTYQSFIIYFDEDFGPASLTFDYVSTTKVKDNSAREYIRNGSMIKNANVEEYSFDMQAYTPKVEKLDLSQGLASDTKYNYDEEIKKDDPKMLCWHVRANLSDDAAYTESVIIEENLPEGLVFRYPNKTDVKKEWPSIIFKGGDFNKKGQTLALVTISGNGFEAEYEPSTDNPSTGKGSLTDQSSNLWIDFEYTETSIKIIIPPKTANNIRLSGGLAELGIWTEIKDPDALGISKDFTNTVKITCGEELIGTASQTQHISRSIISKAYTGEEGEAVSLPYELTINEDGINLLGTVGGTLTVTDELTYTLPEGSQVNAVLDEKSIQVRNAKTSAVLDPKTGEKDGWTYTEDKVYSGSGEVTHTLVIKNLPDGTPLTIQYSYTLSGTGSLNNVHNAASVEGAGKVSSSDETIISIAVKESIATARVNGIIVCKVESGNFGLHLEGAEFKLYCWDEESGDWVPAADNTFVTSDDGKFFMKGEGLKEGTAYKLVETKAPKGYTLNVAPYYFYIEQEPENAPEGFEKEAMRKNMGDTITVENAPENTYVLPEAGGLNLYAAGGLTFLVLAAGALIWKRKASSRRSRPD